MSTVLFCQLLFSALELAFFVVAIEANDIMSLENVSSLMAVLTILLPTYLFCNLAENSTVDLEVSADAFYECSWYNLSTRQQRIFLLPIQRGQAEVRMNALGMVDVSLALFLAVSEWVFQILLSTLSVQFSNLFFSSKNLQSFRFVFDLYSACFQHADNPEGFFILFAHANLRMSVKHLKPSLCQSPTHEASPSIAFFISRHLDQSSIN